MNVIPNSVPWYILGMSTDLSNAIRNGLTWYILGIPQLKLNYPFISMVINAYCSLPVSEYRLCNNGERGQLLSVQMSHFTVVALLTYKATMNSRTNPRQNHAVNIMQLTNYVSQKELIVGNFSVFFPHTANGSCSQNDVASWCCNIKWVSHWFSRRRPPPSTSAFEPDCAHKKYLELLGFFE
jgi:hypothetical protein